ncbi:vWA domain-containing protein [Paenibacillus pini]|nr:vWA domain-containing protein [Paenibacillus pini]
MQRKVNLLLLLFSLIGGAFGFAIGEIVLGRGLGELPGFVVIGIYFGVVALFIGLACLIAEMIAPQLNGPSWRQRYIGTSLKLLVPSSLVLLFLVGMLMEFVYELNPGSVKQVKDVALVIDNSGSMQQTDPDDARYTAAKNMIDKMDSGKRVAVMVFNERTDLLQPFIRVKDQSIKDQVAAEIDGLQPTDGGTDINLALSDTMDHIKQNNSKSGTMVILLSDGFSDVDLNQALAEYKAKKIVVNTVGLNLVQSDGSSLLQNIAHETGGEYYGVANAGDLSFVFQKIYDNVNDRTLVTERTGSQQGQSYYMILRIVALAILGTAIGLGLGLIFDNRYLARSFGVGGAVSGIAAGLILEFGLSGSDYGDTIIRLLACLILAGILALFTGIIPVKENGKLQSGPQRPGQSGRARGGFGGHTKDNRSSGF